MGAIIIACRPDDSPSAGAIIIMGSYMPRDRGAGGFFPRVTRISALPTGVQFSDDWDLPRYYVLSILASGARSVFKRCAGFVAFTIDFGCQGRDAGRGRGGLGLRMG